MEVAIIGSGIIGLLSALTLSDAGYKVTIVARDLPGDESQDWASPWAGAAIFPHPEVKGQDLVAETFRYYWDLAQRDRSCGVQVVKTTEYYDDRDTDSSIWYKHLVPKYRRIPGHSLPAGAKLGIEYQTLTLNPTIYLPRLKSTLQNRGVKFIRQEVKSIAEAKQLTGCNIVVNAAGLGASRLAADDQVVPIRGQTMFVETPFNELVMFQGSHYSYVIPRMGSGGVIVGGVSQEGNTDRGVDSSLRGDILRRVKSITKGALDGVDLERDVKKDIVGFRPGRKGGYRLEVDGDVVHAYGLGGLGYTFGFGVARRVREMVESVSVGQGRTERVSRL